MLHMHGVVVGLRKTTADGLGHAEKAIQRLRTEERVVNEIVAYAVDVRIDHQRVDEPKNQHHPQRRVGVEEEKPDEISQMKQARERWNRIPARVRENLRARSGALDWDQVGSAHFRMAYCCRNDGTWQANR